VAALSVAQSVFASGFQGIYCDANALVPDDALKVEVSSMHLLFYCWIYVIHGINVTNHASPAVTPCSVCKR
jgi:hypothetical protein